MKFDSRNEFEKVESVGRHLKREKSQSTTMNSRNALFMFFNFIGIHPDEFVKLSKDEIERLIESYVDYLKTKVKNGSLHPNTIRAYVDPLERFLFYNRIDGMHEAWKRIRSNYPEPQRSKDGKYNETHLQKMYQFANIRQKAILALLLGGIRVGGFKDLKIRDVLGVEDWASVVVYSGTNQEYHTFITPQGFADLKAYLDYRKRNGEEVTPESPLIRNEFQPGRAGKWIGPDGHVHEPESIGTTNGMRHIIVKIVQMSGVIENSHNRRIRHPIMTCHGFRKYANTVMKASGMDSERVEMLMGHANSSLAGHYWRLPMNEKEMSPQDRKLFQAIKNEYRICIPELTIGESEILRIKNEQLEETVNIKLKQKDGEIMELQRQITKMRENPLLGMKQENIEKLLEMCSDWKSLQEQISQSADFDKNKMQ